MKTWSVATVYRLYVHGEFFGCFNSRNELFKHTRNAGLEQTEFSFDVQNLNRGEIEEILQGDIGTDDWMRLVDGTYLGSIQVH